MINEKLKLMGGKLNISDKDIKEIKKARVAHKILYLIIGAIIAVCAFITGRLVKKYQVIRSYPYGGEINVCFTGVVAFIAITVGGALVLATKKFKNKKSKFIFTTLIITALLSVIGFVGGYLTGQPLYYGAVPRYNVYGKKIWRDINE
ncbi:MAG: hypothetical protein AB1485_03410 [Candidatus Thermoplasmatota archaeon]